MALSEDQRKVIEEKAIEVVYEDVQQNTDYLRQVVEFYVRHTPVNEQVDMICGTNDEVAARQTFDFDPETGEPWSEEVP